MLIGLTGRKGSGKDTAGQFLIGKFGFHKVAFADKLKEAVANLFHISVLDVDALKGDPYANVTINQTLSSGVVSWSWREFLQRFGTEMGRNTFGAFFWIEQWQHSVHSLGHGTNIVVTDVRFENEAEAIREENGYVIEIVRPGYEPDGHASEEPLPRMYIDGQIINNGSLDDFHVDVHGMYDDIRRAGVSSRP